MKSVGIIGGIGPESTIEYYRSIIASYRAQKQDGSYPSIIINSIDLKRMLELIEADELARVTDYLVGEVEKLACAGADFGLLAAGTAHIVFDDVRRRSPISLISIVEAACDAADRMGLKKVGLFATRFTMQGRFYSDVFSKKRISLVVPNEEEQAYIHDKYFSELVKGIVLPETRNRLLTIIDQLKEREAIQGLILGGTELSLILRDGMSDAIPLLDTTQIHARAAVQELLR
ncbi:MAG: aspartate/glutamate racemase family protein [Pyrinomonadaceae bacterium]